jgi:hypothetical protein
MNKFNSIYLLSGILYTEMTPLQKPHVHATMSAHHLQNKILNYWNIPYSIVNINYWQWLGLNPGPLNYQATTLTTNPLGWPSRCCCSNSTYVVCLVSFWLTTWIHVKLTSVLGWLMVCADCFSQLVIPRMGHKSTRHRPELCMAPLLSEVTNIYWGQLHLLLYQNSMNQTANHLGWQDINIHITTISLLISVHVEAPDHNF